MVVISADETIFSKYCKPISKNPVVVTKSGKICLCLVQNQALIEHYDHEVQSKRIVKLIQAMLVPDCQ